MVVVGGRENRGRRAESPLPRKGMGDEISEAASPPAAEHPKRAVRVPRTLPPLPRSIGRRKKREKRVDVCVGVWVDGGGCACRWVGADPFAVTWFDKKKKKHRSAENK